MAHISLRHPHHLSQKDAKALASRIARRLKEEYELDSRWQGNVLSFQRPGLEGTLTLETGAVAVEMELGLMLGMLKSRIQTELEGQLAALFDKPRAARKTVK